MKSFGDKFNTVQEVTTGRELLGAMFLDCLEGFIDPVDGVNVRVSKELCHQLLDD